MHWNLRHSQKPDLRNCWNSIGSQADWGLDSPSEGQLESQHAREFITLVQEGMVRFGQTQWCRLWSEGSTLASPKAMIRGWVTSSSLSWQYVSQSCGTTCYLKKARGTFLLLSRETKLAHKERETAKQLKSDHELKWSTRHEQPLISQLISRMLGGLSVSAQSWSICPLPLAIWTAGIWLLFISFFLIVNGIKDQARWVPMCAKVCKPREEEQPIKDKLGSWVRENLWPQVHERESINLHLSGWQGSLCVALCSLTSCVPLKNFCRQCVLSLPNMISLPFLQWGPGIVQNSSRLGAPNWNSPFPQWLGNKMTAFLLHGRGTCCT